jgi:hypothetical protein
MHRAILFQTSGELGNRLVIYSNLLALGLEHRLPITNLSFWRYAHFFEPPLSLSERPWLNGEARNGSAGPGERLLRGALESAAFSGLRERFAFDGDLVVAPKALLVRALSALSLRYFQRSGRTIADSLGVSVRKEQAFLFSCDLPEVSLMNPALVQKHAAAIRARFRLRPALRQRVTECIAPLKKEFTMLVGVHLRRGDYSRYRGGKWFFDSAVYRRLMLHVVGLFPEKRVVFLLASNEQLDLADFHGLEVRPAPGHLALDMYSLAECDLIIGPPSTFSGWASFIGETPIFTIDDEAILPERAELNEVWVPRLY